MYEPPIKLIMGEWQTQFEENCMRAVQSYGFDVDKNELVKALEYDRNQYEKGYADGRHDAVAHGHWIPIKCETGIEAFGVKEMNVEGFKCSICDEDIDVSEGHFRYCPNCGAKMDEASE